MCLGNIVFFSFYLTLLLGVFCEFWCEVKCFMCHFDVFNELEYVIWVFLGYE